MKLCNTLLRWMAQLLRQIECFFGRRRCALQAACALLLILGATSGCVVLRSTHLTTLEELDKTKAERARLAERVDLLEASNESLSSERKGLVNSVEDLRIDRENLEKERKTLQREIASLKSDRDTLHGTLQSREVELQKRDRELQNLRGTYDKLVEDLESEVAAGQIQIEQLREGIRLNMPSEVLFPSGSTQLSDVGTAMLSKVAVQLRDATYRVVVQGHTDTVPIATARFPSNWELASGRATQVVRLFQAQGVKPERMSGVSYGEYHPVADNATPEGRTHNRRIEVRLMPSVEEDGEGGSAAQ